MSFFCKVIKKTNPSNTISRQKFKKGFPDAKPYLLQKDSLDYLKESWNTELNLLKKFYQSTILLVQHTKPKNLQQLT